MDVNFRRRSDGQYDPDQFDVIYASSADIQGVSRGRFVLRSSFPGVLKHGLGMTKGAMLSGVKAEMPVGLTDLVKEGWSSGVQMPDMATLRPLSWLSTAQWKVGHVICDFECSDGMREKTSSREIAQAQVEALRCLGYQALASATAEITIFYKGTVTPVPLHANTSTLLLSLTNALHQSGIPIDAVGVGLEPGKLQISLKEQPVLALSDSLYRLHQAVRSICGRAGYDVTYMTQSLPDLSPNSTDYTWRLLTIDQSNAFCYSTDQRAKLAPLLRHWLAGQLTHHRAICTLARPTVNCYTWARTMEASATLGDNGSKEVDFVQASWTSNNANRSSRIKVTGDRGCVRLEDTIASSASNPYLVVAAVLAAGRDGLTNEMELPARDSEPVTDPNLCSPKSLKEALKSLDTDKVMKHQLGALFVERFLYLKTDFEIKRFENCSGSEVILDGGAVCPFERDREIYLWSL